MLSLSNPHSRLTALWCAVLRTVSHMYLYPMKSCGSRSDSKTMYPFLYIFSPELTNPAKLSPYAPLVPFESMNVYRSG